MVSKKKVAEQWTNVFLKVSRHTSAPQKSNFSRQRQEKSNFCRQRLVPSFFNGTGSLKTMSSKFCVNSDASFVSSKRWAMACGDL